MSRVLVHTDSFINPYWGYHVGYSPTPHVVEADGSVVIRFHRLVFEDPAQALPPGSTIYVTQQLSGRVFAETEAEIEVKRELVRQAQVTKEEARVARSRGIRLSAEDFWARLAFPVAHEAAIKDVLSGLTEHSSGNGTSARTVIHLRLKEDYQHGRVKRKKNDFLCTSTKGTNGQQYANGDPVTHCGAEQIGYTPEVSCKQCLRLLTPFLTTKTDT